MIYTIGNTKSYMRLFANHDKPRKMGRNDDYPGGSVWQTRGEAQAHADSRPGYSVFGVLADWDFNTEPSAMGDWNDLLVNAELVVLE